MPVVQIDETHGTPLVTITRGVTLIFEAATPFFDPVAPTVNVISQPPYYRQTPVILEVKDNKPPLFLIEIYLVNADGSQNVIFDGSDFVYPFIGSNQIAITGGYQFQIMKRDGWFTEPVVKVRAVNRALVQA